MASRLGERAAGLDVERPTPTGGKSVWALVGALFLAGLAGFVIGSQRSDVVELEG